MILTIVPNLGKLHERLIRFCKTIRRRLAIRVTQIYLDGIGTLSIEVS